ncbi:hypothetical protein BpHYR1_037692 [Brachionus plicatilis]|uniref:Uncharacterized protein n=1 Tax=Brachionus plicatilis TaxID=10195 RepID=A0A3M7R8U5_BRAPC|nr:hypothetical protein BpHYR1_037692 [Brachionus plicatilis]
MVNKVMHDAALDRISVLESTNSTLLKRDIGTDLNVIEKVVRFKSTKLSQQSNSIATIQHLAIISTSQQSNVHLSSSLQSNDLLINNKSLSSKVESKQANLPKAEDLKIITTTTWPSQTGVGNLELNQDPSVKAKSRHPSTANAKVNKSKPTRFESRSSSATKTKIHRTITKTANSSCSGAAKANDSSTKIAVN